MRVNEEIDALEVMAVRPVPYLVSTRIIAALDRDHSAVSDLAVLLATSRRSWW